MIIVVLLKKEKSVERNLNKINQKNELNKIDSDNKFDKKVIPRLKDKFAIFDGAMGTMLQDISLKPGEIPEELNITNPEVIIDIHQAYLNSEADIITTNTFGANRLKLADSPYSVEEVITAGVNNAKEAISNHPLQYLLNGSTYSYDEEMGGHCISRTIALDIGPIGSLLSPLGSLSFDQAYDIFKEQVVAGVKAGANIILIETMTDIYEAKAAILAAKENSDLPVYCTMSFQENGRTFTGTDVATFVFVAEGLGVDVLGANCSLGPVQLQSIVDEFVKYSSTPIMIQANAGLPKYKDNSTYYDVGPEEYAKEIKLMAEKGVTTFGGCCGTSPDYIKAIRNELSELKPISIERKHFTACTSSTKTVFIGDETKVIGERINPTGKKDLKEALRSDNLDFILKEAINQQDTGSDILDINVGLPDIDEKEMMVKVIKEVQSMVSLPLQIDSAQVDVIESAARIYNGKPIINSVNGKQSSMESIFPIVKKYGALVVALTLDENGIPDTAKGRLKIASKLIDTAKSYGIPEENILIDPLVLTASAQQEAVMETLKSIPLIKDKYNVKIVLGTSNISFGLPNRNLLNTTYLAIALAYGLDAPITDSTNQAIMGVIRSYKVIANQDKDSKEFIDAYSNVTVTTSATSNTTKAKTRSQAQDNDLLEIIIKGLKDEAKSKSLELLDKYEPLDIVNEFIIPALDIVGDKYEEQEIFLPQLIRSAETSKEVFEVIKEHIAQESDSKDKSISSKMQFKSNKIVIATVLGDIHDIGKNIVKLILENYGYTLIDLGKDVPIEKIVETVQKEDIKLVGLSALMTTTVKNMEATIKALRQSCPGVKIMVGGAVLTPDYAIQIGADYYSKDAKGAVDIARQVFK